MSYYVRHGSSYKVVAGNVASQDVSDRLPTGTYTIAQDAFGNMFFEVATSFTIDFKLYGNTASRSARILNTFMDRPTTTGVMLSGEKGSGKSLLAKKLAEDAAMLGIPTIIINRPWVGDAFNTFLQQIDQPKVVLFDEFEKVYDKDQQEQLLTLLDGMFPSKTLFVLTCNDKWRVDEHMRNRPGRIFYMLDFGGLDPEFVREYAKDNLKDQTQIEGVISAASLFAAFNFDMLKALIEEMNRYGESARDALQMLNVKPEFSGAARYTVSVRLPDGTQMPAEDLRGEEVWHGNPLSELISISVKRWTVDADGDRDYNWVTEMFKPSTDLQRVAPGGKQYIFLNQAGYELTLNREIDNTWKYAF